MASAFPNAQPDPAVAYSIHHYSLHAGEASSSAASANPFFSRSKVGDGDCAATEQKSSGILFAQKLNLPKPWSFEQERAISGSDPNDCPPSPPLLSNNHHLLCHSAAASGSSHGVAENNEEGAGPGNRAHLLGSGSNVGFLPLPNSNAPFFSEEFHRTSTNKQQYCTAQADMEILHADDAYNAVSRSVHGFESMPSSLTHQSAEQSNNTSDYHLPYNNHMQRLPSFSSTFTAVHHSRSYNPAHDSQLFCDHHHHHHQLGSGELRSSPAAATPQEELLLLPGISARVVEASSASAFHGSSKLDLLHASSLHNKTGSAIAALSSGIADETGRLPPVLHMWNANKLEISNGLGLHESISRNSQLPFAHSDQVQSAAQSGLSLLLQTPLQRAHSVIVASDAARFIGRSASGSLGVLRSSKYLKAAQQLLSECCDVNRDGSENAPWRRQPAMGSTANAPCNSMQGDEFALGGGVDDHHEHANRSFFCTRGQPKSSHGQNLQHRNDESKEQQKKASPSADPQLPAAKQLPADERCHLQMKKARLVAMVEELDRRYQQYQDQMQLIITSYETAAGMGGANPYTTLARKAMSRQFRGLRDAIGEHIKALCGMLGEEVSSVPILSRGETPRLRLVDQRLRHQRSLQQIGMLPHQQAWRPQRGLPERAVSVLRAWLFEHFLHPYPKDPEKAMLARLTGLSRNQVSNWFINARVRLWKPMIEEMYIEESKALQELQELGTEGIINAPIDGIECAAQQDAANVTDPEELGMGGTHTSNNMHWIAAEEEKQAQNQEYINSLRGPGFDQQVHMLLNGWQQNHFSAENGGSAYNDLQSFIRFHSSARNASSESCQSHPFSWVKLPSGAAHVGDIGSILNTGQLYSHGSHQISSDSQASALIQHQISSSALNINKNGVSLTLGLQQPPLHSASNPYHGRPSETLLF